MPNNDKILLENLNDITRCG